MYSEERQRELVQKAIEDEKYCKEHNLCRNCMENKATTHDQLFVPICQDCRDYLEYGVKKFNKQELSVLGEIVDEWLNEGFVGVSNLTEIHYSICKKMGIKIK